jgi:glucose/arabinose dehydrogenase
VVGTIATGLSVPWGIAFLPDGSALVTERDTGRVLHLTGSGQEWKVHVVGHIAEHSITGGEGGLLGVAVSPSYQRDHRVFFYVSASSDNRVVRTTYRKGRLGTTEPVLTGIPVGVHHDGGRIAFGPDGYLYVSTGESGVQSLAQDKSSLGGKILRITESGRPAPGDPWSDSPVWSWGHRNIQGLVFDQAGRLWASEFGDREYDELNLIRKRGNYGWPFVQGRSSNPAYVNPAVEWPTEEASSSGLALANGSFWLAALRGERLWRVPVHGRVTGTPKAYFIGRYGRMRTVVTTPDGNLWLTTSNHDGRGDPRAGDDRILLVRP